MSPRVLVSLAVWPCVSVFLFGCGVARQHPEPREKEAALPRISEAGGVLPQGPCQKGKVCEPSAASLPTLEVGGRTLCFALDEEARWQCAEQLGIVLNPDLPDGPCRRAVPCEQTGPLFEPGIEADGKRICFLDEDAKCACAEQLGVREQTPSCQSFY